ncbi:conserved hypothetical protein [Gammaproteobacteria bacterium]
MPDSVLLDLPTPIALVCHDAGATNLLFAWMRAHAAVLPDATRDWRLLAQGPAAKLWTERGLPQIRIVQTIDEILDGAAILVSGTGWASDLEYDARAAARARGIRSQAVIDHWVNYRERFIRHGQLVLPDEIVVTDIYALEEAKRCFPDLPVRLRSNLYLQEMAEMIAPLTDQVDGILYVLEPIRNHWGRAQAGEFQALDYFAENFVRVVPDKDYPIRLRPHPSDPPGKYDAWIAAHPELKVAIDQNDSLAAAIGHARWIVGAETFAMVVALAAGRQVISTLPPWAHRCRLPHPAIIHLRE